MCFIHYPESYPYNSTHWSVSSLNVKVKVKLIGFGGHLQPQHWPSCDSRSLGVPVMKKRNTERERSQWAFIYLSTMVHSYNGVLSGGKLGTSTVPHVPKRNVTLRKC